jgi:hypothetical protein
MVRLGPCSGSCHERLLPHAFCGGEGGRRPDEGAQYAARSTTSRPNCLKTRHMPEFVVTLRCNAATPYARTCAPCVRRRYTWVSQWYTVRVPVVHGGCPSGTWWVSQWYTVGVPVVHGRCPSGTWSVSQWYMVGVPVVHGRCPSGTRSLSQWDPVHVPVGHGACPSGTRGVLRRDMGVEECVAVVSHCSRVDNLRPPP